MDIDKADGAERGPESGETVALGLAVDPSPETRRVVVARYRFEKLDLLDRRSSSDFG
jgi:hypothetical protein